MLFMTHSLIDKTIYKINGHHKVVMTVLLCKKIRADKCQPLKVLFNYSASAAPSSAISPASLWSENLVT